jgi:hypothetical protein
MTRVLEAIQELLEALYACSKKQSKKKAEVLQRL